MGCAWIHYPKAMHWQVNSWSLIFVKPHRTFSRIGVLFSWEVKVLRCSGLNPSPCRGTRSSTHGSCGMGMEPAPSGWRCHHQRQLRFSPCSTKYPPLAPDGVVSGVTSHKNSSLTQKSSEDLKAFLSQQTSFSTTKPLLTSPSSRCKMKKTQTQKLTYRAAPSETEGMAGKLHAVAEMKDAAMTFC